MQQSLLLYQYSFALSSLYAEDALAKYGFAVDCRDSAFEGHPDWEARDDLHQDDSKGPHIEAPGLTLFWERKGRRNVRFGVLSSPFEVFKDFWGEVLWGGCGDLSHVVELEGWTEINELDVFDVGLVSVHLH